MKIFLIQLDLATSTATISIFFFIYNTTIFNLSQMNFIITTISNLSQRKRLEFDNS